MALPGSGQYTLAQLNTELGRTSSAQTSLNDANVRELFNKPTGAIAWSDGHSKNRTLTFSFSPTSFTYNGGAQGPTVTNLGHAWATWAAGGTQTATNAGGPYNISAVGTGMWTGEGNANYTIAKANQATVSVTNPSSMTYGDSTIWTGSGGSGSGLLYWTVYDGGGYPGGWVAGSQTNIALTSTLPAGVFYSVDFYRAADTNYNQSNTAMQSMYVNKANQATVSLSGPASGITGTAYNYTASGGSGTGAWVFGSSGSGGTNPNSVTWGTAGTYSVNVYKAADGNYNQSNTDTVSSIVISDPLSVSVSPASDAISCDSGGGSCSIDTSTLTATPSGGSGGYTYSWTSVNGTCNTPTSSTTTVSYTVGCVPNGVLYNDIVTCTVTDSNTDTANDTCAVTVSDTYNNVCP